MANEGKFLLIADASEADEIVAFMKQCEFGEKASVIGSVVSDHLGKIVEGIDILVIRELTGALLRGARGRALVSGRREARNTLVYDEVEVERITRVAFDAARRRRRHVTHVHKANVLEVSQLWVEVVNEVAKRSKAVLLGAVGGPEWDAMPVDRRPEKGLLAIRKQLGLFANLRPATVFPALAGASTLRPEVVEGIDILVVRELTGGLYFGEPRGRALVAGRREARNTLVYDEVEIERIARVAFNAARRRRRRVTHVHKANVLEVSQLWIEVGASDAPRHLRVGDLPGELVHRYAVGFFSASRKRVLA